jgi:hypothetical protein
VEDARRLRIELRDVHPDAGLLGGTLDRTPQRGGIERWWLGGERSYCL